MRNMSPKTPMPEQDPHVRNSISTRSQWVIRPGRPRGATLPCLQKPALRFGLPRQRGYTGVYIAYRRGDFEARTENCRDQQPARRAGAYAAGSECEAKVRGIKGAGRHRQAGHFAAGHHGARAKGNKRH